MGLIAPVLRLIVREHKRQPLEGSALTLGRQNVYVTFREMQQLLRSERVAMATLQPAQSTTTNIPSWQGTPFERYTSDVVFFKALGMQDVKALDFSDAEGAEIIHDLNLPIPNSLKNRFELIVNGGTCEHVFDIRQCLANLSAMLAPGGRIIHVSPMNNYANHGFYQFSPTLFLDYYTANNFSHLRCFLIEHDVYHTSVRKQVEVFETRSNPGMIISKRPVLMVFIAEKTVKSTEDRLPTQAFYQITQSNPLPDRKYPSITRFFNKLLPMPITISVRRVLNFDRFRKPWGLQRIKDID